MKGFRDVRGERKRREKRSELSYYKKKKMKIFVLRIIFCILYLIPKCLIKIIKLYFFLGAKKNIIFTPCLICNIDEAKILIQEVTSLLNFLVV